MLCVDVGAENLTTMWSGHTRFEVVRSVIKNWIIQRELLSDVTWTIVRFDDEAEVVLESSERDVVLASFDSMTPEVVSSGMPFDFGMLCKALPIKWTGLRRVVVLFGRSDEVPVASIPVPADAVDVLYVHHKPSESYKCQMIYDFLTTLHSTSYYFETSTSLPKLQQFCALLLAHPDLRDPQDILLKKLDWLRPPSYLDVTIPPPSVRAPPSAATLTPASSDPSR